MKLTKQYIKQIINEELQKMVSEAKEEYILTYKGKKVSLPAIQDVLNGNLSKNTLDALISGARKMGSMGVGNWEAVRKEGPAHKLMAHTGVPEVAPVTKRSERVD